MLKLDMSIGVGYYFSHGPSNSGEVLRKHPPDGPADQVLEADGLQLVEARIGPGALESTDPGSDGVSVIHLALWIVSFVVVCYAIYYGALIVFLIFAWIASKLYDIFCS